MRENSSDPNSVELGNGKKRTSRKVFAWLPLVAITSCIVGQAIHLGGKFRLNLEVEKVIYPYGGMAELASPEILGNVIEDGILTKPPFRRPLFLTFAAVQWIELSGSIDIAPDELKPLTRLATLEHAALNVQTFTDEHCAILGRLKVVQLSLTSPFITEKGIRSLRNIEELRHLSLSSLTLSDRITEQLARLYHLNSLDLSDSYSLDAISLSNFKFATFSGLSLPAINDETLITADVINSVTALRICGSNLTDEGFLELRRVFPSLEDIQVSSDYQNTISDEVMLNAFDYEKVRIFFLPM